MKVNVKCFWDVIKQSNCDPGVRHRWVAGPQVGAGSNNYNTGYCASVMSNQNDTSQGMRHAGMFYSGVEYNGNYGVIDIGSGSTIRDLRLAVQQHFRMPEPPERLMFAGATLKDKQQCTAAFGEGDMSVY